MQGDRNGSHHHPLVAPGQAHIQAPAPDDLDRPVDHPVAARQPVSAGRWPAHAHRERAQPGDQNGLHVHRPAHPDSARRPHRRRLGRPTPLLEVNDKVGIIIKVVPRDGTTTGVGGHVDFYVPNGVTVEDVAYLMPGDANPADGISGYDQVPMKGQSLIAVGAGPIGAKTTAQLIGLGSVGPNVLGSTDPVGARHWPAPWHHRRRLRRHGYLLLHRPRHRLTAAGSASPGTRTTKLRRGGAARR